MQRSMLNGEQSPGSGDAFQLMFAALTELDARPRDEILDCAGDEDLSRTGKGTHASRNMHS